MKIVIMASATIHSSLTHRLLNFARVLVRHGHEVTIIAPRADKYSGFTADMPIQVDGISMVYPYQFQTKVALFNLLPYLAAAAWKVWRTPSDLVYIFKPTPLTVSGIIARFARSTPVVLDMDDLGSEVMAIEKQPRPVVALVAWCERLTARAASGIVVASELLEHEYREQFPDKAVIRLSNGVNLEDFVTRPLKRPTRIIFFGALNRASLLEPILRALPAVLHQPGNEHVEVDILGGGLAESALEALAGELGLLNQVHFHGWTKLTEVSSYAQAGDIGLCIMPNERTTAACSNQKVFQYMAMGLVPVVSRVGDLPLYVDHGRAGEVVPPGDQAALSATLTSMLAHPVQRHASAKRAYERASLHYTWRILGTQLASFLDQVRAAEVSA